MREYYGDPGNITVFPFGVEPKSKKAHYARKPKVAYLGYLGGYWINLDLLAKLSREYDIDVYGAPAPPKNLGLHYCGYAKPSVLSDYQFGLITLSKDRLRNRGFSAKHLEYLSFGLPVLMPEWRSVTKTMGGTLHYNEKNFSALIHEYSSRKKWEALSEEALVQSRQFEWEKSLKPLLALMPRKGATK